MGWLIFTGGCWPGDIPRHKSEEICITIDECYLDSWDVAFMCHLLLATSFPLADDYCLPVKSKRTIVVHDHVDPPMFICGVREYSA